MIDLKTTLSVEWLENITEKIGAKDKILVEKTIRALVLLEGLVESGIDFIFKGGTALLLKQQNTPKRLSIDIDIIIPKSFDELGTILTQVARQKGFERFEGQNRKQYSEIDKGHFKFFYKPIHQTRTNEEAILLDILFEENPYQKIEYTSIQSPFLRTKGEAIKVKTPSFEDLLGDKMTAFAPNTTGVPYYKGADSRGKEILKQLYDIGNLFDYVEDLNIVRKTFAYLADIEAKYRGLTIGTDDVSDDIFQTALCLTLRGNGGKGDFENLLNGINGLKAYTFTEKLSLEKMLPTAGKAAYLSALMKTEDKQIEKLQDERLVLDLQIEQPHNTKLNKLKKTNPDAFWYWWKAVQN